MVPNLLHTGAGSPTGITVYEGKLLPKIFHSQVIHCDAGPSVVRAYITQKDGAGYSAEMIDILNGSKKDKWFRPSDVAVAPDGTLFASDWYDPGVGGHNMRDLERGRIFMVGPEGHNYSTKKLDSNSLQGAIEGLKSPNEATRYIAWHSLNEMGKKAEILLQELFKHENPVFRARALWLLGKIDGEGQKYVDLASIDKDFNIRIVAIRLARQLESVECIDTVAKLFDDPEPSVRRECALALRHLKTEAAAKLWAELAVRHDGKDRWYLEALGISSDLNAGACFSAWLQIVGDAWDTPSGRDIVWRSRAKEAAFYLIKILKNPKTPSESHPRYVRAIDFHSGPEREKALEELLDI